MEAAHDAFARRPPPDLCFRDLQPTRPGLAKRACRELKSPRKRSLRAEACSANLLRVARGARAAGFAGLIDLQTLVTHNHTIICGSLKEGLTCSPCARHAQAYCHKKDCVRREVLSEIITNRSFRFLFTVSCPILIRDFRDCSLLIINLLFNFRIHNTSSTDPNHSNLVRSCLTSLNHRLSLGKRGFEPRCK